MDQVVSGHHQEALFASPREDRADACHLHGARVKVGARRIVLVSKAVRAVLRAVLHAAVRREKPGSQS